MEAAILYRAKDVGAQGEGAARTAPKVMLTMMKKQNLDDMRRLWMTWTIANGDVRHIGQPNNV